MEEERYFFATGLGVTYAFESIERKVEDVYFIETLSAVVKKAYDGDLVDPHTGEVLVGLITIDQTKEHIPNIKWAPGVTGYTLIYGRVPFELHLNIRPESGYLKVDSEEKAREALSNIFRFNLHALPRTVIGGGRPTYYFDVWGRHGGKDVIIEGIDKADKLLSYAYWEVVTTELVKMSLQMFFEELDKILLVNAPSKLTTFSAVVMIPANSLLVNWEDNVTGPVVIRVPKKPIDAKRGDVPKGVKPWVLDIVRLIGETNMTLTGEFCVDIETVERNGCCARVYKYEGRGGPYVYPPLPASL